MRFGAGSGSGSSSSTGDPTGGPECAPGELLCAGKHALECDAEGHLQPMKPCDVMCVPGVGCALCVPGTASCRGDTSVICGPGGQSVEEVPCDPVQGLSCDPGAGRCVGACAMDVLTASYIGCDYFPTVTPNVVSEAFDFAVAVSNTSGAAAKVTITRAGDDVAAMTVAPGEVEVATLPWVAALKSPQTSAIVQGGAYRLRSDRPVTVYQYSPLQYKAGEQVSYSNDASLLLPTHVWGTATRVLARNTFQGAPGALVVVARRSGTLVEIHPSATAAPVHPGGGVGEDGAGELLLGEGDALVVLSAVGGGAPDIADLTGTLVLASAPVQVIGAHACTNVPYDKKACDHLEETSLPLDKLADEYLLTAPLVRPPKLPPQRKARIVRIVAAYDLTALAYDPPQPGAPTVLLQAGDYGELTTADDLRLGASAPVAVAEYMLGQSAGGEGGDPAMTIAVPPPLFRAAYAVHAPLSYESNFVNLVAPTGALVDLDGKPIPPGLWSPIGASGFSAARILLDAKGEGDHELAGDQPFGVQVYGYGQYTSYWYPGGLDL